MMEDQREPRLVPSSPAMEESSSELSPTSQRTRRRRPRLSQQSYAKARNERKRRQQRANENANEEGEEDRRQLRVVLHRLPEQETTVSEGGRPAGERELVVMLDRGDFRWNDEEEAELSAEEAAAVTEVPQVPAVRPRRRHALIPRKVTYGQGRYVQAARVEELAAAQYYLGPMTDTCRHCSAKFFRSEPVNRRGVRLFCCKDGAYALQPLGACPPELRNLLTDQAPRCRAFRENIRVVNSLFAMASFKVNAIVQPHVNVGQGAWCFVVQGQVYHFTQGLPNTQDLQNPRLNHYYFIDAEEALEIRAQFMEDRVPRDVLQTVERMLRTVNPFVEAYMTMSEVMERDRRNGMHRDDMILAFRRDGRMNEMRRSYNLPESENEFAAIFNGEDPPFEVDLRLYPKRYNEQDPRRQHHELKNLNPLADPMVYPLLFPRGEEGWSTDLCHTDDARKKVTIREFYRYRLQTRDVFSTLHHGGKLFQQYVVDAWIRAESNELWWFRNHQRNFRRAARNAIRRYNERLAATAGPNVGVNVEDRVGRAYVLPSVFQGGYRNKQRMYLDAMTVIARHGKPDLFITFTCNPRWKEIIDNLEGQQRWQNRPDLVCRVFKRKLDEFIDDIVNKQVYGVVLNYTYVIEFQKRGLPHAHIMVTFIADDRLEEADAVDGIISAVIPNREATPQLYDIVAEHQLHCSTMPHNRNAPCMREIHDDDEENDTVVRCSKRYPKQFKEATILNVRAATGIPEYKRPDDGRTITIGERVFDNRWVVPYNAYASAKYQSHINFEVCGSLASMKYLHKYVTKGSDTIEVQIGGQDDDIDVREVTEGNMNGEGRRERVIDEIKDYVNGRRVSAPEAVWRLFEFKMHDRSHSVMVLPVHLPGEDELLFDEEEDIEEVEQRLGKLTKLEAWFRLNAEQVDARQFKYREIPEHFVWENRTATWKQRRQVSKVIGCIAEVSPSEHQLEKFYLRMLLQHVRGVTSFEDLLTVDGERCATFREACDRRNLIRNVEEYDRCLQEAALLHHPQRFRKLFGTICCLVADGDNLAQIPLLWRTYKGVMAEDYLRRGMRRREAVAAVIEELRNIIRRNRNIEDISVLGIHMADEDEDGADDEHGNNDDGDHHRYHGDDDNVNDSNEYAAEEAYHPDRLNEEQKRIFADILKAIVTEEGIVLPNELAAIVEEYGGRQEDQVPSENLFYVDGPGGTGKTYLYNTIISVLDTLGRTTISVAWTGIAAALLKGGTTVHRAFRLPLTITETTVAGWAAEHRRSEELRGASLIIWDEAPMTPKNALHAVDRCFRDLTGRPGRPLGGKIIILGGDFRQTLPVVPAGGRGDIVDACLKSSPLWPLMKTYRLTTNMRAAVVSPTREVDDGVDDVGLEEGVDGEAFSDWLLKIGEGRVPHVTIRGCTNTAQDLIHIPRNFIVSGLEQLLEFVYGGFFTGPDVADRAILTPTNAIVKELNAAILDKIPGEEAATTYVSVDEYCANEEDDDFHVTVDVLNSIESASLPPHELTLKRGCVVMLLRNIDVEEGLCNGTRLLVRNMGERLLECETLTGERRGNIVWIPKVNTKARGTILPREMKRLQFPVKLAYAMTINKSQGQTFQKVGVYLKSPCFSHGQMYVALSRVGSRNKVKICVENGMRQGSFKFHDGRKYTRNVVFRNIVGGDTTRAVVVEVDNEDEARFLVEVDGDMIPVAAANREERMEHDGNRDDEHDDEMDILRENVNITKKNKSIPTKHKRPSDQEDIENLEPQRCRRRRGLDIYSSQERRERVATQERPGTSGMCLLRTPRISSSDESESD